MASDAPWEYLLSCSAVRLQARAGLGAEGSEGTRDDAPPAVKPLLDGRQGCPDDAKALIARSLSETSAESIGARLRRLRLERGLSQRQLGSRGVSSAYISRIESGDRTPSVRTIRLLARKLGVTPGYLETGAEIAPAEALELRLSDAELRLRLGDHGTEARHALQAVLKEAQSAGETELAMRAQIALGLSSMAAGNQREAVRYLGAAVASPLTSPAAYANVYISLSKALRFMGRAGEAATMLEGALDELDSHTPDADGTRLRLATYLSYALTDLGEFERARVVLRDVDAAAAGEPHAQVTIYWSLARLAYMEGRPREALREIRRAIILLDHTEDSLELARAHLFSTEVHLWAGDVAGAARQVRLAARLESLGADARDLGAFHSCQALVHARRGEYVAARRVAERARQELAEAPAEQGLVWLADALTDAGLGDFEAAEQSFEHAIAALTTSSMHREAAAVCREWSELLNTAGRQQQSEAAAERAAELAQQANAEPVGCKNRVG
jgi:transcriptional regulator with XRE-family HTH domain